MNRNTVLISMFVIAIAAGAIFRAVRPVHGPMGPGGLPSVVKTGGEYRCLGDTVQAAGGTESSGEASAPFPKNHQPEVPSSLQEKKDTSPRGKYPDLKSLRRGVRPRKSTTDETELYLLELNRKNAARARAALEETRREVREWEEDVFEPTW